MLTASDLARCRAIRAPGDAVAAIVEAVAAETGISAADIRGTRRWANISAARQVVYYAAHRDGVSVPQIAAAMGRDASTVQHGIKAERERRGE